MKFQKTPSALAAIALCSALPLGAQTTSLTIEAESMQRVSYALDGSVIKLTSRTGTASKNFSGTSGIYNMQVYVLPENDGQSRLELYKGSELLRRYTYPLGTAITSFTVSNVALTYGEVIKLVGTARGDAWARVDKIVLTPVASGPASGYLGTPYSGTAIALPKAFEAVNFDNGGQGVAYSDLTAGNAGGLYRTAEDVDIIASSDPQGGAYAVNNFQTGEWLAYTVEVPADGNYDVAVRASNNQASAAAFHIEVDGLNVTGSEAVSVPNTGSWNTFQWVGKQGVSLKAGTRVLKVVSDQQYFNLNAVSVLAGAASPVSAACANPSGGYEGFGRNTTGGAGKIVYRVTNLDDSGTGSLRDALSQGDRCVVFDVGGTISLASDLLVKGANVTIDGFSAPSPGITLRNRTLVMQGASGASNVVLRGIRSRGVADGLDAIRVFDASNVVIDHVSVSSFGDGAVDVTENSRDVTIQWSILGNGGTNSFASLIKYDATRVSVHHNLYINNGDRNPHCGRSDVATSLSPEIVCDVRNNLIWNYKWYGTPVKTYGTANIVNNYYYTTYASSAGNTIYLASGGSAYVSGNYSGNGWDLNARGNRSTPYAAVLPATTDAVTAAHQVLAQAGARGPTFGLDAADQGYIGQVSLQ